ncbi:hypothetical protein GCM10009641_47080 [Mycobacterium cookii]|uniref:Uncharacterized protein n=1 Tax=Nocardioides furvisabuli TaxID=375542 RepID=A0ABN2XR29_9ACTN
MIRGRWHTPRAAEPCGDPVPGSWPTEGQVCADKRDPRVAKRPLGRSDAVDDAVPGAGRSERCRAGPRSGRRRTFWPTGLDGCRSAPGVLVEGLSLALGADAAAVTPFARQRCPSKWAASRGPV